MFSAPVTPPPAAHKVVPPQKSFSASETNHSGYQATIQQQPKEGFWYATFHEPINLFTFVLALATVVLGVSTILLWLTTKRGGETQADKMERSIEAANRTAAAAATHASIVEDTARRELRAYVGFPSVFLLERHSQDPRFEIGVQNFGQTPATGVTFHTAIAAAPKGADRPVPFMGLHEFGTMEPGRVQSAILGLAPSNFENPLLENGQQVVTIWGLLTYFDIYGGSYTKEMTAYVSHRRINNNSPRIGTSVNVFDEIENDPVPDEDGGEQP